MLLTLGEDHGAYSRRSISSSTGTRRIRFTVGGLHPTIFVRRAENTDPRQTFGPVCRKISGNDESHRKSVERRERLTVHQIGHDGFVQNERLKAKIKKELKKAGPQYRKTKRAVRIFKEFYYKTRKSWSERRRVVAKAEHLEKGENQRFVVNSLTTDEWRRRCCMKSCIAPAETWRIASKNK